MKLAALISDGGTLSVSGDAHITLPADVCTSITHICLFFNKLSVDFSEAVTTNNHACINVTEDGIIHCSDGTCTHCLALGGNRGHGWNGKHTTRS